MGKRKILWAGLILVALTIFFAYIFARSGRGESARRTYRIGIATLITHPSLDSVIAGLKEQLAREGFVEGKNIVYIERNANGQLQLASSIASDLASQRLDALVPITTPVAQAALKKITAPIIFAAVTDPVGAGVVPSLTKPGELVTGASDAWPYGAQLRLIREILPNAHRLGVLLNPGDAASQYGIKRIRELGPQLGFGIIEGPITSTADVFPVSSSLADRVDVLFLSSDSMVIAGIAGAVRVAIDRKVPLFVGDSGTVAQGGIGAVSVGYHELGRQTGALVARVLHGERNIPVVVASGTEIYLNTEAARLMGVEIPNNVITRATMVYKSIK